MNNTKNTTTIFEISWEVCNKVGGIHTVISTKAKELMKKYPNLIMIGPDLPNDNGGNNEFIEDKNLLKEWHSVATKQGLKFRIGRWNIPGKPIAILVDFTSLFQKKDQIFYDFWERYHLDSLRGGWDYIEPVMFGYAAGQIIESYYKFNLLHHDDVIAQFHEWMTGSGILYLKNRVPGIATVFTTHATILGRTIAGNNLPLYNELEQFNPEALANQFNITAKYSLERISAEQADVFTTVSSITARECKYLLKKEPDIVTPNGFEDDFVPEAKLYQKKRNVARETLKKVSEAVLGYPLNDESLYVLTSGRYEFKNKGIDIYIKALDKLRKENPERQIVAYISVPAGIKGVNQIVADRLSGKPVSHPYPCLTTHELYNIENDLVIGLMKTLGIENSIDDPVKIIFTPVYLNGNDGLINLHYYDWLTGFDLTVFASYYEPWGYTPMESLAFHIPTITTSLSGFGSWIKPYLKGNTKGTFVIERNDINDDEVMDRMAGIINNFTKFSAKDKETATREAQELSRLTLWKELVQYYFKAYDKALELVANRKQDIGTFYNPSYQGLKFEDIESDKPLWKKVFVKPKLPEEITFLEELSKNLWWTWQKDAEALFREINPELWEKVLHNPVQLLEELNLEQLDRLKSDTEFIKKLQAVEKKYRAYMSVSKPQDLIVYFSMEFGLHDTVKIFSGGLGILAGDYMKEASDSNYNITGVGLLYRYGYFTQKITLSGDQISGLVPQRFTRLPVTPVFDDKNERLLIDISLPGRTLYAQVWRLNIGRNILYLLDTDIPENNEADRKITAQLYGGGLEMRLLQEILLGIGGIRLLKALNIEPGLVHINEGHAAMTGLERLRILIEEKGLSFEEAKEVVRASALFTTHTPVPAGHDVFPEDLIRAFLPKYHEKLHLSWDDFMALGRVNPEDRTSKFSMSVLAAKLSQEINGVSKIHGEVSRRMFNNLYPGYYPEELHIGYVTNGVHLPFWVGSKWDELYRKFDMQYVQNQLNRDMWRKIYEISDNDIWHIRTYYRQKLIGFLKERIKNEMIERGESPSVIFNTIEGLRDDALTIGFARRFATYKRALLIFNNIERLKEILNNTDYPVQIIFAGKAHPNDKAGQDLIKRIIEISKSKDFIGKIFFIENYDINVAKYLVQGVDVWLNNPTRPLEASGTSGEKAVMNGVLNFSVLDGWWAEGYVEGAGWALKQERTYDNQEFQDALDALTIYNMLENEIIPAFYQRNKQQIPVQWVEMIKKNISEILPGYTMKRMIEDYNRQFYAPQLQRVKELSAGNYQKAKAIVQWKKKIMERWDDITILNASFPDVNVRPLVMGEKFKVSLTLDIKDIAPEHIGVEILLGRKKEDNTEELLYKYPLELHAVKDNIATYQNEIPFSSAGVYDFTFRVYPKNDLLPHRLDFPLFKWI